MEIPLYVFQEELQKSFRLTGQFSRPDYLCHTLRLYGPGTVLKAHVLYVVPEDQLERFQDAPGRREPDFYSPCVVFSDLPQPDRAYGACLTDTAGRRDLIFCWNSRSVWSAGIQS